jgi:poly(3-hydroxybutyrate) depolymerase
VDPGAASVDTPFWKPFPKSALRRFAPESTAKRTRSQPCVDCVAIMPETTTPGPLLVVLHGDSGATPADLANKWDRFAAPRDVGVLALACPRDRGCKGSFWQWDGDPAWTVAQVDALAAKHPVDRHRVYLAGWSGGASYIGMHTQAFQDTFAGIVIHGGGHVPLAEGCAKTKTPIAFLYGTANPLHALGVRLHEHYESCGDELSTTLIPDADHAAELRALDDHGGAILDFLLRTVH